MNMVSQVGALLATELFWNVIVWLPTLAFSLVFVRVVLGIRMRELVAEVEEHQTAAVGAVFFWTSFGFSMLISKAVADPPVAAASYAEALFWLGIGMVIAVLFFVLGTLMVFGVLARRQREGMFRYIQRELRREHNLSLTMIMGALFIVPVVVAYHMTV